MPTFALRPSKSTGVECDGEPRLLTCSEAVDAIPNVQAVRLHTACDPLVAILNSGRMSGSLSAVRSADHTGAAPTFVLLEIPGELQRPWRFSFSDGPESPTDDFMVVAFGCESTVADAVSRLYDQLEELRQLEDDWNGYGSEAPNDTALGNARFVLHACRDIGRLPDRVVPSADDGVGLYFTIGPRYVLIECFNSGDIVAGASDRQGDIRNIDLPSGRRAMEAQLAEFLSFLDG